MSKTFFVASSSLFSTDALGVTAKVSGSLMVDTLDDGEESGGELVKVGGKLIFEGRDPDTYETNIYAVDFDGNITQLTNGGFNEVNDFTVVGDTLFVTTYSYSTGSALYRYTSDGTLSEVSGSFSSPSSPFATDNGVFFLADTGDGNKLHSVDANGTVSQIGDTSFLYVNSDRSFALADATFIFGSDGNVTTIHRAGSDGSLVQVGSVYSPSDVMEAGGSAYFTADDGTGRHFYKLDSSGTLTQVLEGTFYYIGNFKDFGGLTYFSLVDTNYSSQLYSIDATGALTLASVTLTGAYNFTEFNGGLYFAGSEIEASGIYSLIDGTISATGLTGTIDQLTVANGKLFAVTYDYETGLRGLQSLDASGTAEFVGGPFNNIEDLTVFGDSVYMITQTYGAGEGTVYQIYKVDGSGVFSVVTTPSGGDLHASYNTDLKIVDGALVFSASDGSHGLEPWKITVEGEVVSLGDLNASPVGGIDQVLAGVNGQIVDTYSYLGAGSVFFLDSNGVATPLTDENGNALTGLQYSLESGGSRYFLASQGPSLHLYKYDASGLVTTLDDGSISNISYLTESNGSLIFTAMNASSETDIYKIDGTTGALTQIASDLQNIQSLYVGGGTTYFLASDGVSTGVYSLDASGQIALIGNADLRVAYNFVSLGISTYFIGRDQSYNDHVYKIDSSGALSIVDETLQYPGNFVEANGNLFFSGYDGSANHLYKIDADGVFGQVASSAGYVNQGVEFNGTTYLTSPNGLFSVGLDGSLSEVTTGVSNVYGIVEFNGELFFTGNSQLHKVDATGAESVVGASLYNVEFEIAGGVLFAHGESYSEVAGWTYHLFKLGEDGTSFTQVEGSDTLNDWSVVGDNIYFTTWDGTSTHLFKVGADGVAAEVADADLPAGIGGVYSVSQSDTGPRVVQVSYNGEDSAYFLLDANGDFVPFSVIPTQDSNPEGFESLSEITNHAPVAVTDVESAGENETTSFDVMDNDTDEDEGDTLTLVSIDSVAATSTNAAYDGLDVSGKFTIVNGEIAFVPGATFNTLKADEDVTVTIGYTIEDAAGEDSSSTLTVTIEGENDAVTARADSGYKTTPGVAVTITKANLLGNDSDIDGDTLTVHSVQGAQNGTVKMSGGNVIFTPGVGYAGPASFTYTVSDGNGSFSTAKVTLDVKAHEITGSSGANIINGTAGVDVIEAGLGDDFVNGLGSNDIFMAKTNDGNDFYDGGAGKDTFNFSKVSGAINVLLGDTSAGIATGAAGTDVLASIENVVGGSSNDTIVGNGAANHLIGGAGADKLSGLGGRDTLEGGRGNDKMSGGSGIDTFVFGAGFGRDKITDFTAGGTSHDVLHFSRNVFSSIADVLDSAKQSGDNVVIKYDANNYIVLEDLKLSALRANAADDIRII